MAPPKQLSVHANWHEVSRILGLPRTGQALPLKTACPLCHGNRLSIYQDSISLSDWHYCFDCRHAGDMIELAAAVWGTTLSATIIRLAHEGLRLPRDGQTQQVISDYIETDLARRHQIEKLWERSQQSLLHGRSSAINGLRKRLGLLHNFSQERVAAGPARLYGAISCRVIEKVFQPNCPRNSSSTRPFKGPGWTDVLVLPYYAAPRRISGMLFIGRNGSARDMVMRTFLHEHRSYIEAGLAGLDLAVEHPGAEVIAISNPATFLKLQMRNFNTSMRALPLVCWYPGKKITTRSAWEALIDKRIILWESRLTPDVLLQCHRSEGHLILSGPTTDSRHALRHYLRKYQPADLVKKLIAQALPWREVVADWLRSSTESQILTLMQQLRERDEDAVNILRECDPRHPLWDKPSLPMPQRVRVNNRTYLERAGRWLIADKGGWERRVIDAVIRINYVILRGQKVEYEGELRIADDVLPFRLPQPRNAPMTFTKQIVRVAAEAGRYLKLERQVDLARIAMAFHEPQILKGRTQIGWVDGGFRFKHFSIQRGHFKSHHENIFPPNCPGPQNKEYRMRPSIVKQLGSRGLEAEVTWATLVSLAAAVLAAPAAQEGFQTLLVGHEATNQFEAILDRCGVGRRIIHHSGENRTHISVVRWPHRWPVSVTRGRNNVRWKDIPRWLLSSGFPGVMHVSEPVGAYVLLNHGGFTAVHCDEFLRPAVMARFPVEHGLLCYLRYATEHLFREKDPKDFPWWERVQADMAAWLEAEGSDATALRACRRWVRLAEDPTLLRDLIVVLYRHGYLRPEDGRQWKRSVPVPYDARGLVLTKELIGRGIRAAGLIPPDLEMYQDPIVVSHREVRG